ncbi:hypothetical protein VNO80_15650 [Phaseolus coccineus]|uniref:Uncharacterized protein n=1 Tax=Phaseolus coccineus TaxID=3886 RepID=A0AAN9MP38_PHACN
MFYFTTILFLRSTHSFETPVQVPVPVPVPLRLVNLFTITLLLPRLCTCVCMLCPGIVCSTSQEIKTKLLMFSMSEVGLQLFLEKEGTSPKVEHNACFQRHFSKFRLHMSNVKLEGRVVLLCIDRNLLDLNVCLVPRFISDFTRKSNARPNKHPNKSTYL